MCRLSAVLSIIAVLTLATFSGELAANPSPQASATNDVAAIYTSFLNGWNKGSHSKLNVAQSADLPTSRDTKQFGECAKKIGISKVTWASTKPVPHLASVLGQLSYVHFVNPHNWHPLDPRALMASGQSVGAAVSAGMSHGLVTLSAITFNKSHTLAMFTFSFVCGGLCGSGRVAIFRKTSKGWVQSKTWCGGWQA